MLTQFIVRARGGAQSSCPYLTSNFRRRKVWAAQAERPACSAQPQLAVVGERAHQGTPLQVPANLGVRSRVLQGERCPPSCGTIASHHPYSRDSLSSRDGPPEMFVSTTGPAAAAGQAGPVAVLLSARLRFEATAYNDCSLYGDCRIWSRTHAVWRTADRAAVFLWVRPRPRPAGVAS